MPISTTGSWSRPGLRFLRIGLISRRCSGSSGFTLIELMVVMVLITILTAFAVPTLRHSLFSDQLRATARRLVGLVSEASQEAVGRQIPSQLNFDLEQNRVWLSRTDSEPGENGSTGGKQLVLPDSVRIVDVATAHGGKIAQGTVSILFSSKGYVDRTFIHLRDDDGRDVTVMVSPFIAVTRVEESYIELDDETVRN